MATGDHTKRMITSDKKGISLGLIAVENTICRLVILSKEHVIIDYFTDDFVFSVLINMSYIINYWEPVINKLVIASGVKCLIFPFWNVMEHQYK